MSEELFPIAPEEQAPAVTSEQAPATMLSEKEIEEIQAMLAQAVEIAEGAMERIRKAAGPQPGKIPQEFITSINQGAGFLRHCRDTIGRMFREWRKINLQQSCEHSRGAVHIGRKAECKICGWEFVWGPKGYVPKERIG